MELLVSGCSFTKGHGLESEQNNPRLWVNQLSKKLNSKVNNIAHHGYSNQSIFLETLHNISVNDYDLVIVAWSVIPRWNFNLGFELHSTHTHLNRRRRRRPINTNLKHFSAEWQNELKNKLLEGHNDHWHLLELVKYVNILINMQTKLKNQKIVFVNTYGPWPDNFFSKKNITSPSDLSDFEQNILNVEARDNEEIFKLYNLMHEQYSQSGGIQEKYWLNLYNSFEKLKIDNASEVDFHPGYASQDIFVEQLWPILEEKIK